MAVVKNATPPHRQAPNFVNAVRSHYRARDRIPYSTPTPSYAPSYAPYYTLTAMLYEGVAIRFVAILIDTITISIIASIFSLSGAAGAFASLVVALLYSVWLEGYYGQTVGKMAVNIKVVRGEDGGPIDFSQATMRTVLWVINLIPYSTPCCSVRFSSGPRIITTNNGSTTGSPIPW